MKRENPGQRMRKRNEGVEICIYFSTCTFQFHFWVSPLCVSASFCSLFFAPYTMLPSPSSFVCSGASATAASSKSEGWTEHVTALRKTKAIGREFVTWLALSRWWVHWGRGVVMVMGRVVHSSGFRNAHLSVLLFFVRCSRGRGFSSWRAVIRLSQLFCNARFLCRTPWNYCAVFVGRALTKSCSSATVRLPLNVGDPLLSRLFVCVALCYRSRIMNLSRVTWYNCFIPKHASDSSPASVSIHSFSRSLRHLRYSW